MLEVLFNMDMAQAGATGGIEVWSRSPLGGSWGLHMITDDHQAAEELYNRLYYQRDQAVKMFVPKPGGYKPRGILLCSRAYRNAVTVLGAGDNFFAYTKHGLYLERPTMWKRDQTQTEFMDLAKLRLTLTAERFGDPSPIIKWGTVGLTP